MSYVLTALVGRPDVLAHAIARRPVALADGFALVPLDHDWRHALDLDALDLEQVLPALGPFALEASVHGPIAYLHIETFGGAADQCVVVWDGGDVVMAEQAEEAREPLPSNRALQRIGVVAPEGQDEFDTLGLGRHRETEDWLADR